MAWIQTHSGVAFDLLNPQIEQIDAVDIAWSLAMICRYNGHTSRHYSVAEHSLLVSRALARDGYPEGVVLGGLLHDAVEAYIGDISAPLKWASPALAAALKELEDRIEPVICEAFDIERVLLHDPAVKVYDRRILLDESAALLGPKPRPWNVPGPALGVDVQGLPPIDAAFEWATDLLILRPDMASPGHAADRLWQQITNGRLKEDLATLRRMGRF